MKTVLVQFFFVLIVVLSGYVLCLPMNKTLNNSENLKKIRGNFDYSKLASVINSSESNNNENGAKTETDVEVISETTTEIQNLVEMSEKNGENDESTISIVQNEDDIQPANGSENSSELPPPMVDISSKSDTTTKILSESENPLEEDKSDKDSEKTSDKESDSSKKDTDSIEMNLKPNPKNDLQPTPSLAAGGKPSKEEKPILMDKPFIHPFDNFPYPYIPYQPFPFPSFPDPYNIRPLTPIDHIATGNVNFDYQFPNKFDQDFFKYLTAMIEKTNEDGGSFNFVKHHNDRSMENIEGYFDDGGDVSGDTNIYVKGGYSINLPKNDKESSSVSYVIDDKGCLTRTH